MYVWPRRLFISRPDGPSINWPGRSRREHSNPIIEVSGVGCKGGQGTGVSVDINVEPPPIHTVEKKLAERARSWILIGHARLRCGNGPRGGPRVTWPVSVLAGPMAWHAQVSIECKGANSRLTWSSRKRRRTSSASSTSSIGGVAWRGAKSNFVGWEVNVYKELVFSSRLVIKAWSRQQRQV